MCAASWAWGYFGTWFAKWVIAAIVFGAASVKTQMEEMIGFRLSGQYSGVQDTFGAGVTANVRAWLHQSVLVEPVLVAGLAFFVVASAIVLSRRPRSAVWLLMYVVIAAIPFVWYTIVSNHSQIHAWFTFRSLAVALASLTTGAATLLAGFGQDYRSHSEDGESGPQADRLPSSEMSEPA